MAKHRAITLRRLAVSCVGAAVAASGLGAAAQQLPSQLAFDVRRGDSSIGRHTVEIRRNGETVAVDIAIDLKVSFAFVTLFEYRHRNREIWRDGRLVCLDSTTDDDGTPYRVTARATEAGLLVDGSAGRFTAPPDIVPTSYWNPETRKQTRLLDTQRGRLLNVAIAPAERAQVGTPTGAVPARRYRVSGDLRLDLWYTEAGHWVKTAFEARGATVEYRLREQRPAAAARARLADMCPAATG